MFPPPEDVLREINLRAVRWFRTRGQEGQEGQDRALCPDARRSRKEDPRLECPAVTVDDALKLARDYGVRVTLDGNDLALEADAPPPPRILAILGRGKWDIVAVLRQREAEERRRIVQWVNDHFTSSPPGVCAHCGGGERAEDPFVLLFVGNDRGEVHASCHSTWLAEREAEARRALGLEVHSAGG